MFARLLAFVLFALPAARAQHAQALFSAADAHGYPSKAQQGYIPVPESDQWLAKYGPQLDSGFSGPLSFAHWPYARCLEETSQQFDVAIIGMPFDTTTSYRPGARFGPYAIRSGSRRQHAPWGYSLAWHMNPYDTAGLVMDCGDVSSTHSC